MYSTQATKARMFSLFPSPPSHTSSESLFSFSFSLRLPFLLSPLLPAFSFFRLPFFFPSFFFSSSSLWTEEGGRLFFGERVIPNLPPLLSFSFSFNSLSLSFSLSSSSFNGNPNNFPASPIPITLFPPPPPP